MPFGFVASSINGKRSITAKMVLLLEKLSAEDYPAEFCLMLQLRWDLSQARRNMQPNREAMVQEAELAGNPDDYLKLAGQTALYSVSEALRAFSTETLVAAKDGELNGAVTAALAAQSKFMAPLDADADPREL